MFELIPESSEPTRNRNGGRLGLLLNFNVELLKNGIKRIVL